MQNIQARLRNQDVHAHALFPISDPSLIVTDRAVVERGMSISTFPSRIIASEDGHKVV